MKRLALLLFLIIIGVSIVPCSILEAYLQKNNISHCKSESGSTPSSTPFFCKSCTSDCIEFSEISLYVNVLSIVAKHFADKPENLQKVYISQLWQPPQIYN